MISFQQSCVECLCFSKPFPAEVGIGLQLVGQWFATLPAWAETKRKHNTNLKETVYKSSAEVSHLVVFYRTD